MLAYVLRTSNAFGNDLALSVAYFPTTCRLYGVFFGLRVQPEADDVRFILNRFQFGTGLAALAPISLLSVFLELEKKNRLDVVKEQESNMIELVRNFESDPDTAQIPDDGEKDGLKELVGASGEVASLKCELEKWKDEVTALREETLASCDFARSMQDPTDEAGRTIPLVDADVYLGRLVREYDDKIRKCDAILATVSLAFQMVRKDQ